MDLRGHNQFFKTSVRLMRLLISYTQGVIGGNIEPSPEPLKLPLTYSRLKNIRLYLLSGGHSHTTRREVEENSKNKKLFLPGVEHERLSKKKHSRNAEERIRAKQAKVTHFATNPSYKDRRKVLDVQSLPLKRILIQ